MDATLTRQLNTLHVLQTLQKEKHVSRVAIAKKLGLSRPTITLIVNNLIAQGIVQESHLAKSTGGRPPVVLRLTDNSRFVLGIDMGSSHITIMCCDLNGNQESLLNIQHDVAQNPKETLQILHSIIEEQLDYNKDILCICITVPCPVAEDDSLDPRILPHWKDYSIQENLSPFGIPLLIENDANAGAFAELWWKKYTDDFIYLKLGTGIGAGIISDGVLLHGKQGLVGEIGHYPIPNAKAICRCGQIGCLEAIIGTYALQKYGYSSQEKTKLIVQNLFVAILPLVYALNPQKIILWGEVSSDVPVLLQQEISQKTLWPSLSSILVDMSSLGETAIAQGACGIALNYIFEHPGLIANQLPN